MEISTKKEVVIVAIFAFLIDMNVIGAVLTKTPRKSPTS